MRCLRKLKQRAIWYTAFGAYAFTDGLFRGHRYPAGEIVVKYAIARWAAKHLTHQDFDETLGWSP